MVAILGVEKLLRIELTGLPETFVNQCLDRMPDFVPAFGRCVGFRVAYRADLSVTYSRTGEVLSMDDKPVTCGYAWAKLPHGTDLAAVLN
jgi:hypothetical protein